MLVIKAETHKMLDRIADREDPESDLGLQCLSRTFWSFSYNSFVKLSPHNKNHLRTPSIHIDSKYSVIKGLHCTVLFF